MLDDQSFFFQVISIGVCGKRRCWVRRFVYVTIPIDRHVRQRSSKQACRSLHGATRFTPRRSRASAEQSILATALYTRPARQARLMQPSRRHPPIASHHWKRQPSARLHLVSRQACRRPDSLPRCRRWLGTAGVGCMVDRFSPPGISPRGKTVARLVVVSR